MPRSSPERMVPTLHRMVLVASVGLLTGCGADGGDPVGPGTRLDAPDPVPGFGANSTAPQATDLRFGDFALHVPANVTHVRGILVALGGPNTQGFVLGTPFGAPPDVEPSLQELGRMFRALAAEHGLAILGSARSGTTAYPNEPASDQLLLGGIAQAATLTGRADLVHAPLLLYGMSGGGPQAWGFTQRNPRRVAGLFLKVPVSAGPLTGQALRVPAYLVLAGLDVAVDNTMLSATFEAHRAAGAPWAMALEPRVPHVSLSPAQREVTVDWMRALLPLGLLPLRALPPETTGPFGPKSALEVGWLGDPATGQAAPARTFAGPRGAASWFPTRALAVQWAAFIGF
jgi:hypothetical protein